MTVRLPSSLTWRFGDYRPPPALERIEGTSMEWTDSIADRATSRLLSQFREKPRLVAFIRAVIGAGVQDLHDAMYQALTERWIDTGIGAQIDRIGWVLDLPRAGWADETFRRLLRAQVLVLRSSGTWRDFAAILRAVDVTLAAAFFERSGTAAATVYVGDDLEAGNIGARDVFSLLNRAKPAAVRFELVWPTAPITGAVIAGDASGASDALSDTQGAGDAGGDPVGGLAGGVYASTTLETE